VPEGAHEAIGRETDSLRRTALGEAAAERFGRLYTDILLGSVVHEVALVRVFAGDPTDIDAVWVWPDGAWPPSLELTGRLPDDGRVTIRWHYLPDYPAYREEVRLVYEDATIELAFASPYLLHRPTVLRVATLDGDGRRDEVWTSIEEAFETQILAFRDLIIEDRRPFAGLAEGRADIVTFQRAIAAMARQQGVPIGGEAAA
jgi:predicted dehydrogenase